MNEPKTKEGRKLSKEEHARRYGNRWARFTKEERSVLMSKLAKRRMAALSVEARKSLGKSLVAARKKLAK